MHNFWHVSLGENQYFFLLRGRPVSGRMVNHNNMAYMCVCQELSTPRSPFWIRNHVTYEYIWMYVCCWCNFDVAVIIWQTVWCTVLTWPVYHFCVLFPYYIHSHIYITSYIHIPLHLFLDHFLVSDLPALRIHMGLDRQRDQQIRGHKALDIYALRIHRYVSNMRISVYIL